ncbi:MAG TPA: TetR/AcrR family transcriptional regulator [Candidatus Polarisedimenticolia bacterium]|nr:TetR/AcrR family transcriptional regulator [Candidatus Polarisedimenticolia bacterium]
MGRPRSFDLDRALDRALVVFWRKGYEGASLSDLTKAVGVNRPSLYAAFGDKEALFRKALGRYLEGPAAYTQAALREPTARAVVERLLLGAADLNTARRNPGGCLMVQGALAGGEAAGSIRRELAACRAAGEAAMRRRFERAKSEGDLPANMNPADLARYIATVLYGMAVEAAGGASRSQLQRVVEMTLRTLPM